jgi:hypothetical protein
MSIGNRVRASLARARRAGGLATWAAQKDATAAAALESRARELEERARRLVSLFEKGEPSFRMRAKVKAFDLAGARPVEGTYTLDWEGTSRWREEIVLGETVAARGVSGDRWWLKQPAAALSLRIHQIRELLGPRLFEEAPRPRTPARIRERAVDGARAVCVRFVQDPFDDEACYDVTSGVLLRDERHGNGMTTDVRSDAAHAPFRDRLYPRARRLSEDRRPAIEAVDVELTDLPDAAPDTFAPPDGAEALPWCEGLRAPERTRKVNPAYPESARMRRAGGASRWMAASSRTEPSAT